MSSTQETKTSESTDLSSLYCVNYKSPAFIGAVIACVFLILSSIAGAFYGGKRSGASPADAIEGGAGDGLMSIKDFLDSMR